MSSSSDEYIEGLSKPMPWIGVYISVASLFCTLAMAADLFHGFRNKKFWFPCKYFTLNAASITVISVAMKLPLDLNNPMPGKVDIFAKLGSMVFMCTLMANLMPSLATMDNKELLTNVIALGILVITVVVNFCIQIGTGLLFRRSPSPSDFLSWEAFLFYIYAATALFLLTILTSLALTIPTFKNILEAKYQVVHKSLSDDQDPQNITMSVVCKLQQHVRRYWVMAGTSSPQFVMSSFPLCYVSGVICLFGVFIHLLLVLLIFIWQDFKEYKSDYKWSMSMVFITQFIGVIVGVVAPIFRCFTALNFELSIKWSMNLVNIFKVESYYIQKLLDWKHSRINFQIDGRKCIIFVHKVMSLILSCCIGFQKIVVVVCKLIGLVLVFIMICVKFCSLFWKSFKSIFFATPIASNNDTELERERNQSRKDLKNYVLQLQDENVLTQITFKRISNSVDRMIRKAEKQCPNNLLELFEKSTTAFQGVENFDSDHVPPLLPVEPLNCWSLPIVTLTSIAIMLPNIESNLVASLLNGVSEGLLYVRLVEEILNGSDGFRNVQRATKKLWLDVEVHSKWLENNLKRNAHKGKTLEEILQWFSDKAQENVEEIQKSEEHKEIALDKSIAANSMYRITQTILLNYQGRMEHINEEELFVHLSSTIADILTACLTNLPRVIAMKCYTSAIEKREESMEIAAQLFGQSKVMINKIYERELPCLDPDQMAFIDEWRAFYKHRVP